MCYSIGSPNLESNSRDTQSDPTVIFKLIKNTFRFKGRQSHRNCWSSTIRSKNDSFNEEEKTNGLKSRFDRLEAIVDNEDSKFNQVTSLETQELLASKLADLEDYHSCMNSVKYHSGRKSVKRQDRSSNMSYSSYPVSSGDKSPNSSVVTPQNAVNFQGIQTLHINCSAKSSGIVNCSTEGQEESLDLQSPETKTCLFKKLYALKEEHQMYESDNGEE